MNKETKKSIFHFLFAVSGLLITIALLLIVSAGSSVQKDAGQLQTLQSRVDGLSSSYSQEQQKELVLKSSQENYTSFYNEALADFENLIQDKDTKDESIQSLQSDINATQSKNDKLRQELTLLEAQLQ
ncbi:MAG: hypothetical protein KC535_04355 [Nanoarchaeota archaeon]|nr:hypothetical protein [Nanoarchaeota archaeon]